MNHSHIQSNRETIYFVISLVVSILVYILMLVSVIGIAIGLVLVTFALFANALMLGSIFEPGLQPLLRIHL